MKDEPHSLFLCSFSLEQIKKSKIAHVPHKQILFYLSLVVTLLSCLSQTFSLSLHTNKPSFYLISFSSSCSLSPCSLLSPTINLCVRAQMCVCMCACQREFIWISLQSLPITQVINQQGWWSPHPSVLLWVQMPNPVSNSLTTLSWDTKIKPSLSYLSKRITEKIKSLDSWMERVLQMKDLECFYGIYIYFCTHFYTSSSLFRNILIAN